MITNDLPLELKTCLRAKRIACNSAVYMELSSGSRQVNVFWERLVETAAAATPACFRTVCETFFRQRIFSNKLWIKLFVCFRVSCVLLYFVRSKRTVGAESIEGAMSKEGASSVRFRLFLDFSRCGRMRMPRGGIFDSDSSNNLMFSVSKTQL